MKEFDMIEGQVVRYNSIQYEGKAIQCWTNSMQSAEEPQPLDLSPYMGKVVGVKGYLHGDLWGARFMHVVHEDGNREGTVKEKDMDVIEGADEPVHLEQEEGGHEIKGKETGMDVTEGADEPVYLEQEEEGYEIKGKETGMDVTEGADEPVYLEQEEKGHEIKEIIMTDHISIENDNRICPNENCQYDNHVKGANFCILCGTLLHCRCEDCVSVNQRYAKFCYYCGSNMSDIKSSVNYGAVFDENIKKKKRAM